MSKLLQLRGGTTSEHGSFTGAVRETTVDTTKDTLVVHDGSTAGGFPLARESALAATTTTAGNANTLAAAALPKAGGTMSGLVNMADQIVQRPVLKDYAETKVAMGSATAVNLENGNVFSKTISGTTTLTFPNPSSAAATSFSLILTNGGSATLNFPSAVDWAAATAPTLTASGIDILTFTTIDGGTIWYGIVAGQAMG